MSRSVAITNGPLEWVAASPFMPTGITVPRTWMRPEACSAQHPDDWTCTRRSGHTGRHAAATYDGQVWAVWS